MAATAESFRQMEQLYVSDPGKYRRKVAAWIALGYGSVFLMIAFAGAFVVIGALMFVTGTIPVAFIDNFIKAGIPLLIIAWLTTRAVFMRLPSPAGIYLQGPLKEKILSKLQDIRIAADGRRIDEVLLTNELNAAVVQTPKFGLFGPTRNYLILGAPLLQLLSLEEVRAVVAHEFGHLSHGHGRMSTVVYRLNQTLTQAAAVIGEKNRGGLKNVSFRFLQWFYRHFNSVTFAMRRGQEFEADQVARKATSAAALASALCKLNAFGVSLNEFWNQIWSRPRDMSLNTDVYPQRELREAVLEHATPELSASLVDEALGWDTDFRDSHPCLRERLEALGTPPVRVFGHQASALIELLTQNERDELLDLVDLDWQLISADNWERANKEYAAAIAEMQELRDRDDPERQELLRLAQLEENLEGIGASLPTHERLASQHADDASIQFGLGRASLGANREAAHRAFLRCLELDVSYYPDVARYLQADVPEEVHARLVDFEREFEEAREKANRERESVSIDDNLVALELNDDIRRALSEYAARFPEIRRLYLVEKPVLHFRHDRVFLVGFDLNKWHDNVETDASKWLQRASADFARQFPSLNRPYSTLVTKKSPWADRLANIEGSLIYEGSGKSKRTVWQKIKLVYWIVLLIGIAVVVIGDG